MGPKTLFSLLRPLNYHHSQGTPGKPNLRSCNVSFKQKSPYTQKCPKP